MPSDPAPPASGHDLIVIGASMDGIEALRRIVARLPEDLPAAVCVVQHTGRSAPGYLPAILDDAGPLRAAHAEDGEPLAPGRIYVARADRHLIVRDGHLRVANGPLENRSRPAIDPLFRSAAVSHRSRAVGVVLSGLLDDGSTGLSAIHRCGGLTVVQSPADAAYPDMPENALAAVAAHHVVPAAGLGELLGRLARTPAPASPPVPDDLAREVRLAERVYFGGGAHIGEAREAGEPVDVTCPDCGGAMVRLPDPAAAPAAEPALGEAPSGEAPSGDGQTTEASIVVPDRFRCYLGHAYSAGALVEAQRGAVERALWAALRLLEERAAMLERMARTERERTRTSVARDFEARATEARGHAEGVRALLG